MDVGLEGDASAAAASQRALRLACAVFFASGFAALLYQVIWQRLLALFSGADIYSVTLIVAAFMGGLGIGNLAGGHLADRLSRAACFAWFAAAEVSIALFAIVSKSFYYDFLYARLGALDLGPAALGALLFASVLWPTFFMGLSLPLLARGLARSLDEAARVIGSLYGWNTFGAAIGALTTTWILLRHFDFETILRVGAALNFLCAAAALALYAPLAGQARISALASNAAVSSSGGARAAAPPLFGVGAWLALFFFSGAIALSLEIAWFRALGVMLKSTSFTFGTLLAVYLLGNALGSLWGTRLVERARSPGRVFLAAQTGVMLWAVLALGLFWMAAHPARSTTLASYFGMVHQLPVTQILLSLDQLGVRPVLSPQTEIQRLAQLFVVLHALLPLVLIGPATVLMGFAFPFLQRAVQTDASALGRRVGWLQSANIAGSLAGSLLTGFVLLPVLGTPGTFRALACAALCFPLLALLDRRGWSLRSAALPGLGAAALGIAAWSLPDGAAFWARLHGADAETVVLAEDAAGVSVSRLEDQGGTQLVMAGGFAVSSVPYGGYGGTHTLLGLIPALIHPSPARIAVIGIGSGDTAYAAAARSETRELVAIEIIGSQLDVLDSLAAGPRSDPGLRAFLRDPRIRRVVADGRTWLRRDPGRFDVIEADALVPSSAYSGNLYSREYFALLRERLAPGGMAVSWLPTGRVADTLASVFPHVLQLGSIGIASDTPIAYDPAALIAAAKSPAVRKHFRAAGIEIADLVIPFARNTPAQILAAGGPPGEAIDLNSDLFAKDEFVVGRYRPILQRKSAPTRKAPAGSGGAGSD